MKYSEKLMELYSNPKNVGSLDEKDENLMMKGRFPMRNLKLSGVVRQ